MRGYFSFVLVLVSLLLVFSLLDARGASLSSDMSKAISVERAYSLQMNVKECILEAARQGALEGFDAYDSSHDIRRCMHCPDSFCSNNPTARNRCDSSLCKECFREDEARDEASGNAESAVRGLSSHAFDRDFELTLQHAELEVILKPEPAAKNGFSPDYLRFAGKERIRLDSDKLGISAEAYVPQGVVVYLERAG